MSARFAVVLAAMLIGGSVTASANGVTVSFVHPEGYSNGLFADGSASGVDKATLDEITQHLDRLASQGLAPGQVLVVDVLDFTRAGMFDPRHSDRTARIYSDTTPPRITVRYRLLERNVVVVQGEERLVNVDYLSLPTGRLNSDPLRYEKALIADWFRYRVVERRLPPV
jgi:prepilin-type processing-associated H-X9-DG protein